MQGKKNCPLIYGHRGESKFAPENTISAFQLAFEQGADGIELDTMLTADSLPIIIHDNTLDRTTSGSGDVDACTMAELSKLDAGSWFSPKFCGEKIPLLEDVLDLFKGKGEINIELKNYHAPFDKLPERVLELVGKTDMFNQIIFSSFLPMNLNRIKQVRPEARVALLYGTGVLEKLIGSKIFLGASPSLIHPQYSLCNAAFVSRQHAMGRLVNAWTANDRASISELIENGVDGIITDDPRLALEIRG